MTFYKKDLRSFMAGFINTKYEEQTTGADRLYRKARRAFGTEHEIPGGMWVYPDGSEISLVVGTAGLALYYRENNSTKLEIYRYWQTNAVTVSDSYSGTTELYKKLSSVAFEYVK